MYPSALSWRMPASMKGIPVAPLHHFDQAVSSRSHLTNVKRRFLGRFMDVCGVRGSICL